MIDYTLAMMIRTNHARHPEAEVWVGSFHDACQLAIWRGVNGHTSPKIRENLLGCKNKITPPYPLEIGYSAFNNNCSRLLSPLIPVRWMS